jgi:large subunit ribosomal protein L31
VELVVLAVTGAARAARVKPALVVGPGGEVMKPGIHPDYANVNVHCACGATWTTRSTKGQELRLEICSNCHPFFTGKQRLIDSAGQIEKFTRKWGKKKDAPAAAATTPAKA